MSRFEKNLSEGNVVKQLIMFSLPFLISNIIQSLYSVVDMVVVGKYAGTISMSGVNIGSQVTFLITNMVFGLCVGATVLIGQYMGCGNREAIKKTIGTLFTSLMVLAVVLTVVMIWLEEPILRLIKTPEEAFSEAKSYFFVTMLGTFFIFGYNALSAVMRGMGDSKNPLYFVAIACAVNIVLDVVLVAGFNMGALGAAVATVVSQAISMILCVVYLAKNEFIFDFKLQSFVPDYEKLKLLLKIGVPSSIQNTATSCSFLFLTALVNTIGVTASAAVGAVGKFNGFAILPGIAMSNAISAMAAQNIGAGKRDRAVSTMKTGLVIAMGISVLIFALAQIFPAAILSVFADKNDPLSVEMTAYGAEYLRVFSFDYLIAPAVFCLNGLFIGAGHTFFSLINGIISSLAVRIPACWVFGMAMNMGLRGVGLGGPVASFASLILAIWFFLSGGWKKEISV